MRKPVRNLASAFAALAVSLSAALAMTACSGDDDLVPVAVSGVTISSTAITLTVGGGNETIRAAVQPSNAANKILSWSDVPSGFVTVTPSDTSATVAPVAVTDSPVTVTVTTDDGGFTETCAVTVVAVADVTLNHATMSLVVGGPAGLLTAAVWPAVASQPVKWHVDPDPDDPDTSTVATVLDDGLTVIVKPVAPGEATITVESTIDPTKTAICTVTVSPA
jgi:uncharacterized protein YjdB